MTDKKPKNKPETPVNPPEALAKTTDTVREGESKSKALPQANALKERFKAGSIPLETDFADLIDLANMGRQAVGGAEGQNGLANGFILSSVGRLELKPNETKGISVDKDGIAVNVEKNKGLQASNNGVSVKTGNGIAVNNNGVNIKLAKGAQTNGGEGHGKDGATSGSGGGLNLTEKGLSVDPGNGMQLDVSGVSIKLPTNSGLRADENSGLRILLGNGVATNSSGVNIKLAKGRHHNGGGGQGTDGATSGSCGGLYLDSKGLSIDAGNGIKIDDKGLSIKLAANSGLSADENNGLKILPEQMLQKGMIMMFSGSSIPSGWALCDGSGGRPDLRNRFVLGASGLSNIGKTNGKTVTGTDTNKQFSVNTDSKAPAVSVKVNGHKLTIAQMPAHNHGIKSAGNEGLDGQALFERNGRNPSHKKSFINTEGSGQEHSHGASGSQSSHSHSVNVVPPYYTLAFIIKL